MAASFVQEKTPVGLLHESCSKRGLSPLYELISEGQGFEYRVTVGDLSATGRGRKKKFAKQAAAKALLSMAVENGHHVQWHIPGGNRREAENYLKSLLLVSEIEPPVNGQEVPLHGSGGENAVGNLLDKCRKHRWPLPEFWEKSLPDGTFTCEVVVGKLQACGTGRNKRSAKRSAATSALQIMQEAAELDACDDEEMADVGAAYPRELEKQLKFNAEHFSMVNGELTSENCSQDASKIDLEAVLSDSELKKEPKSELIGILEKISLEQNGYEATYYPLKYRSRDGLYQCLVQLPMTPVAVCYGQGRNTHEAKAAAAQNALKYVKIMMQKK